MLEWLFFTQREDFVNFFLFAEHIIFQQVSALICTFIISIIQSIHSFQHTAVTLEMYILIALSIGTILYIPIN